MTKNEFVGLFEGAEKAQQDALTRRARLHLERALKFSVSRQALALWRKNPNSTSKLSGHYLRAYMAAMKELADASCVGTHRGSASAKEPGQRRFRKHSKCKSVFG